MLIEVICKINEHVGFLYVTKVKQNILFLLRTLQHRPNGCSLTCEQAAD